MVFSVDDIDTWGWLDIHAEIAIPGSTARDAFDEFKINRMSDLPKWNDEFDKCRTAKNEFTSNGFFTWDLSNPERTKPTHYFPLPPRKVQ